MTYQDTYCPYCQVEINAKCTSSNLIAAIMLLNSKFTRKTNTEVSEKLNKKRQKNNRPQLLSYTTVDLRDLIISTERGGTHASPRPHWRRGHIRTLQNGKKIPIEPCLVNWEPGVNLDTAKVYKVKR